MEPHIESRPRTVHEWVLLQNTYRLADFDSQSKGLLACTRERLTASQRSSVLIACHLLAWLVTVKE